ncbi:hypothetical protein [Micromonospora deserti]|uniref:Uncharacterized protein n=1 Tax=Micromonospora deserti TaxID=2070366 RepID=A0A2W2DN03_9ACTN|nr:hypothetical protein [Micromonospora deserti]PZF98516.1 hypothetical protein C1I99_13220 [Micromonospora deserti]
MSQQSSNPQEWLAAGELERRQHVLIKGGGASTVFTVEHSLPYRSGPDSMVALTLAPVGGGEPQGVKWSADYLVRLATEDQVADAVEAVRRWTVVKGLRDLADLMADVRPRVRAYGGPSVGVQLLDGEVTRLSEALDLPLSDCGSASKSLTWQSETSDFSDGVTVTFYGKPALEPDEVEQDRFFTFGAGQQFDGRYVRFRGTYDSARAAMIARFGTAWCAQYDSLSPMRGFPVGLVELPEAEWPEPAGQPQEHADEPAPTEQAGA